MSCERCGHANPEGSRFCEECGAALDRSCPSCAASCSPQAKFCRECGEALGRPTRPGPAERTPRDYTPKHLADKILQSKSAIEGERKQVTVLFADVKGSLELAEQVDPEEWHCILDRFFQILADGVHRFDGTVNQYTGDGIMALFGAPIAHEDHAQRACWAALHLRDALRRYADELRRSHGLSFAVRMGMNSGEVVVGKIGDDLRMDYTAQGQVVGLAARMQQLAEPGRIYLTTHTAQLVRGYLELRDLGALRVRGLEQPLAAFELKGAGRLRTRLDASRLRGFTRFVGRGHEMKILESALAQAQEGRGQVVGVVGEAGVGKSRLCFELAEGCRARGITVYEAHCPAHGKVVPFVPLFELLRAYFGIDERDGADEARRKIAGTLLLLDEALREVLPLVFDFLGVPDPENPAPRMDPEARQQRLFGFVRRLYQARSEREPTITLVDDLHWIDPGSDAFLAQAVEVVSTTRTLLLVNFRPEYQAPWMQKSCYQQLALAPLGPQATLALLADLLGRDDSLAGLAERIRERTAGNPFFAEEMVQTLVEDGSLQGSRGAYRLAQPVEALALPATVQAVLAARIDRLGEREKQVLQRAAVIGKELPEPVLRRVAELPEADLAAALGALTRAEFLYEKGLYPEAEYAFKHPLTQEVAYRSQLAEPRARIHAAVARAIEALHPEKLDEQAALLAHHFEEAGEGLEAARWHRRAAEWIGVGEAEAAVRHWRRVRELAGSLAATPESRALAVEACTRILMVGTRVDLSEQEFEEIFASGMELAAQAGDTQARVRLLDGYGTQKGLVAGEYDAALECVAQALELAQDMGDRGLQVALHQRLCWIHTDGGNLQEALRVTDRGLELSAGDVKLGLEVADWSPYVYMRAGRGHILRALGRLEEAEQELDRASQLARAENEPECLFIATLFRTALENARGDAEAQLRHAREAVEMAERLGAPFWRLLAYEALALSLLESEEWDTALGVARQLEAFASERLSARPWVLEDLARAHLGLGDLANAQAAAAEALAAIERIPSMKLRGSSIRLRVARVLLATQGAAAREAAEREIATALELMEATGAAADRPRVHEARAELMRVLGDEPSRERELRQAHRLYTEMGACGHAERLARELGL